MENQNTEFRINDRPTSPVVARYMGKSGLAGGDETTRYFRPGRGAGTRTLDPLIKSQLLYQLSYTPKVRKIGAGEGTRTLDNHLGKVALYQLSYARAKVG